MSYTTISSSGSSLIDVWYRLPNNISSTLASTIEASTAPEDMWATWYCQSSHVEDCSWQAGTILGSLGIVGWCICVCWTCKRKMRPARDGKVTIRGVVTREGEGARVSYTLETRAHGKQEKVHVIWDFDVEATMENLGIKPLDGGDLRLDVADDVPVEDPSVSHPSVTFQGLLSGQQELVPAFVSGDLDKMAALMGCDKV